MRINFEKQGKIKPIRSFTPHNCNFLFSMNLLLAAATAAEIEPTLQFLKPHQSASEVYSLGKLTIQICITGVGLTAATYVLARTLSGTTPYQAALQVGIAGAFSSEVAAGSLFRIATEEHADLGAEDQDERFLSVFDLGLAAPDGFPFAAGRLPATPVGFMPGLEGLPVARGITVQSVSGCTRTIAARLARHQPDVESMEGAAFHYVCLQEKVPYAQVRSISNHVAPRNRDSWQIGKAVGALNTWLQDMLTNLAGSLP